MDLLAKVTHEKKLTDPLTAEIKAAAEEFKSTFTIQKPQPK
jgi:hypothetical protein